ncbi:excinuclease ABC subunit C [Sphingopyxis fribergensis]|uniref:Excinuclease ABC subunit C n=1 Tax=Sphingopyxis fribergensis TaxID=1515612 RepID=A0A0A7PC68_9SPHN|nr:GIY-YIG nuclease family protein [Sphingopyxis fribergensis]AJA07600.1 excinuclease ABC subunit C [Sphingopyxis fribergensis]
MNKPGYICLMASGRNGTTYLGVTSDLLTRAWQHRNEVIDSFSKKYGCMRLVWYEAFDDIQQARQRELQMKKWKRAWKVELIERDNPQWLDLFDRLSL